MVSFRISRSAEDLAETVHALSQRLVKLEQRLAAMELETAHRHSPDPEEIARLDNVERLLRDCRDLLETDAAVSTPPEPVTVPVTGMSDGLGDAVGASPAPGAPGEEEPFPAEPFADVA